MIRKAIQTRLDGVGINRDVLIARDAVGRKVTIPYAFDLDEYENHLRAAKAFFNEYGFRSDFVTGFLGGTDRVYVHVLQENR